MATHTPTTSSHHGPHTQPDDVHHVRHTLADGMAALAPFADQLVLNMLGSKDCEHAFAEYALECTAYDGASGTDSYVMRWHDEQFTHHFAQLGEQSSPTSIYVYAVARGTSARASAYGYERHMALPHDLRVPHYVVEFLCENHHRTPLIMAHRQRGVCFTSADDMLAYVLQCLDVMNTPPLQHELNKGGGV